MNYGTARFDVMCVVTSVVKHKDKSCGIVKDIHHLVVGTSISLYEKGKSEKVKQNMHY